MSRGHTLKIKCPTWEHVESFYAKKVKDGNILSARVPWNARTGELVTLALELPDELVIAIEAVVGEVQAAADERKSAVRLSLVGLTPQLRTRLAALVAQAAPAVAPAPRMPSTTRPPPMTEPALPVPLPTDAPIDELIEPLVVPSLDAVPAAQRPVAAALVATFDKMRASAAHEVLGVARGAKVAEIRAAYFALVMKHHPDRLARHRSGPVRMIAQEVLILVNKAYDRMRDALVAAGEAIAPGPALLAHSGWLAGFDDLGVLGGEPVSRTGSQAAPLPAPPAPPAPAAPPKAVASPPPVRAATEPLAPPATRTQPAPSSATTQVRQVVAQPIKTAGVSSNRTGVGIPAAPPAAPSPPRAPTSPSATAARPPSPPAPPAAAAPPPAAPPPRAPTAPLDAASLFDDIAAEDGSTDFDTPPSTELVAEAASRAAAAAVEKARGELERGEYHVARDRIADALRTTPRDRNARALYHVAQAGVLVADGKVVEATSQLQTALAHDPANALARRALDELKAKLEKKGGLFGRLFSK